MTTSWLNSTTPNNTIGYDWRQIMEDRYDTLRILAITELAVAFIIYVLGQGVESVYTAYIFMVIFIGESL